MHKKELIDKILERKKELISFFDGCKEENLLKLPKSQLEITHTSFAQIKLVEIINKENARDFISDSCEDCKNILRKAKFKVAMSLTGGSKWHLMGVE